MWTYHQASGVLDQDGAIIGVGYSGAPPLGKNNPAMQNVHCVGPIPAGFYTFGDPEDSPKLGPVAIPLIPDPANAMFGRSAFLMHGDSLEHPGNASEGCLIFSRDVRLRVAMSADNQLSVTA